MKKINFFKLVSLLVVVVFAVACKDNYPESHSVDTLIALDKKDVTLHAGESVNLSAKINFQEDGKNVVTTIEKKINWATSDTLVAKIDANGVVTAVAGGTAIITAECQGTEETCAVLVKDIFVAGMLIDSLVTIDTFAVIWQKCDTGAFIKYKVPNAEFSTMVVNEQGIYYAGIENGAAKVWKDGVVLSNLGENITISSMCIEKGNVYVVGYKKETTIINPEQESIKFYARLWKNGESVELELKGDSISKAYDIVVENGNTYVVGEEYREKVTAGGLFDAVVWENGKRKVLDNPEKTNPTAEAKFIFINNGFTYIGGSINVDKRPYVWKDGKEFPIKFNGSDSPKNLKFINNELYAFYGTTLWMGGVKSTDMKSIMIQAKGDGYIDAIESLGSVYVVAQGYPQYANGKTDEIESGYNETALATILLKDNGMVDFLPKSMKANGDGEPKYPKSNAVAIGIR